MQTRLKIAIQKSGRLSDSSKRLLREAGIKIPNGKNTLLASATNFPLDILYLRDDDIPQYVEDGTADLGILGENVILEEGRSVRTIRKLGFSRCRLSLAIPKPETYTGPTYFQGRKIATSYPSILAKYLAEQQVEAEIHEISGSVEIAPNIGLADAVCDIVSSGSTLFSNGLKEVETILKSQAALIGQNKLSAEKEAILDKLIFRLDAVRSAETNKYIILNCENENIEQITKILPGIKSPTVVPLAQTGWSALHSVLPEDDFWEIIDALRTAGAQGILVVPIEKMIL
ncbi:MAG: ATP phosphoribosyltransferase [Bacteroidota bacterium]